MSVAIMDPCYQEQQFTAGEAKRFDILTQIDEVSQCKELLERFYQRFKNRLESEIQVLQCEFERPDDDEDEEEEGSGEIDGMKDK